MERKQSKIKTVQKKLRLKSYAEAEYIFDTVNKINIDGLKKHGSVKIEGIGIVNVGKKSAKAIKVPGIAEKVNVAERDGLFFKPYSQFFKTTK